MIVDVLNFLKDELSILGLLNKKGSVQNVSNLSLWPSSGAIVWLGTKGLIAAIESWTRKSLSLPGPACTELSPSCISILNTLSATFLEPNRQILLHLFSLSSKIEILPTIRPLCPLARPTKGSICFLTWPSVLYVDLLMGPSVGLSVFSLTYYRIHLSFILTH